jgi:hypothetical protein
MVDEWKTLFHAETQRMQREFVAVLAGDAVISGATMQIERVGAGSERSRVVRTEHDVNSAQSCFLI